ncbi:hypothetical protein JOC54_000279 [Alkalihalobacillus xiaoxiensis]|uniref:Uncharacterized protein n=1 Tax=Shouchella xiaoxiensis TaxID=766895 RepID=A0ABS2SNE5_9BACI|nr:hypothetical protein [Shouchella xiaoxiensis]MBM7837048.1 hypothetical protein [Shouchella xiaoxiensis]
MDTFGYKGTYKLQEEIAYDYKRNRIVNHVQEMMEGLGELKQKVTAVLDSSEGEIILATVEEVESNTLESQERLQLVVDEFIKFHTKFDEQANEMKTQPFTITYMEVPKD